MPKNPQSYQKKASSEAKSYSEAWKEVSPRPTPPHAGAYKTRGTSGTKNSGKTPVLGHSAGGPQGPNPPAGYKHEKVIFDG